MSNLNHKSWNFRVNAIIIIVSILSAIAYAVFGIKTNTFSTAIIIGLIAAAAVAGVSIVATKGIIKELLPACITALLTFSFTTLIGNSIDDVTEFVTPTGLFGVAENVPARVCLLILILVAVIVAIISGFVKDQQE